MLNHRGSGSVHPFLGREAESQGQTHFCTVNSASCRQVSGCALCVLHTFLSPVVCGLLLSVGCTEQQGIRPQSLYPEEGPGPRSGQAASTVGSKIHHHR